mgnify:CR=1 FL=1
MDGRWSRPRRACARWRPGAQTTNPAEASRRAVTVNGRIYGLPWDTHGGLFHVNTAGEWTDTAINGAITAVALAEDGRGVISCLELPTLLARPALFSTFLMWLLADLFHDLPEVGDIDKPKLVFFFDEAHLLFDDASEIDEGLALGVEHVKQRGEALSIQSIRLLEGGRLLQPPRQYHRPPPRRSRRRCGCPRVRTVSR